MNPSDIMYERKQYLIRQLKSILNAIMEAEDKETRKILKQQYIETDGQLRKLYSQERFNNV